MQIKNPASLSSWCFSRPVTDWTLSGAWQTTAVAPSKTQGSENRNPKLFTSSCVYLNLPGRPATLPLSVLIAPFFFCWQFYSYNFLIHIIHSFNTYNPVIFTIFIGLYNHHHHLILENFHHPKKENLYWLSSSFPFPYPPPPSKYQSALSLLICLFWVCYVNGNIVFFHCT